MNKIELISISTLILMIIVLPITAMIIEADGAISIAALSPSPAAQEMI